MTLESDRSTSCSLPHKSRGSWVSMPSRRSVTTQLTSLCISLRTLSNPYIGTSWQTTFIRSFLALFSLLAIAAATLPDLKEFILFSRRQTGLPQNIIYLFFDVVVLSVENFCDMKTIYPSFMLIPLRGIFLLAVSVQSKRNTKFVFFKSQCNFLIPWFKFCVV